MDINVLVFVPCNRARWDPCAWSCVWVIPRARRQR